MKRFLPFVLIFALSCKKDLGPSVAAKLAIRTQPSGAVGGQVMSTQPVVVVEDADGRVVTSGTWNVTVQMVGAVWYGTSPVATATGVATFTDLRVDALSSGPMNMTFSAQGLSSITSNTFSAIK